MADHDLIVVGGGLSGGLPAAAYLQKAGLDVLIVEANSELRLVLLHARDLGPDPRQPARRA